MPLPLGRHLYYGRTKYMKKDIFDRNLTATVLVVSLLLIFGPMVALAASEEDTSTFTVGSFTSPNLTQPQIDKFNEGIVDTATAEFGANVAGFVAGATLERAVASIVPIVVKKAGPKAVAMISVKFIPGLGWALGVGTVVYILETNKLVITRCVAASDEQFMDETIEQYRGPAYYCGKLATRATFILAGVGFARLTGPALQRFVAGKIVNIKIGSTQLDHIIVRHTVDGAESLGKSIFSSEVDIVRLINNASSVTAVRQAGGNFERVVTASNSIGIDRVTGKLTNIYTVITDSSNNLVTAFPGKP